MKNLNRVHLNGLRAIEAVGRLGALGPAADELGVVLDYPHRYERARPDRWPEAFGRTRPPRGER